MKKTFYKAKSVDDLTKEQLWDMLRNPKGYFSPDEFIRHYKIKDGDYCPLLKSKGLVLTKRDRIIHQRSYKSIKQDKVQMSKLKPIELIAMRAFRGFSRNEFTKEVNLSLNRITEIENLKHKVTKDEADLYIKTLKIERRHIIQLQDILSGKSDRVEDERKIPPIIKVKVWSRDKCKCTKCSDTKKLHIHHIKHFSKGGKHELKNLILLCASCHAEEHKGEKVYHLLKKIAE